MMRFRRGRAAVVASDTDNDEDLNRLHHNHQRYHRKRSSDLSEQQQPPTTTHRHATPSKGRRSNNKSKSWWSSSSSHCNWTQVIILVFLLMYLRIVVWVYQKKVSSGSNEFLIGDINNRGTLEKRQLARQYLEEKNRIDQERAFMARKQYWKTRKQQSQPPPRSEAGVELVRAIIRLHEEDSFPSPSPTTLLEPASLEDLCGYFAENASLTFPQHYPLEHALTGAKVVVSGILHSIGYQAALTLKQECEASIYGLDTHAPNTFHHQLTDVLPKLQLLELQNIPVVLTHVGIDAKGGGHKRWNVTAEVDWVDTLQPSHILHAMTFSSPPPYPNSSLYAIRTALTSLEQWLSALARWSGQQQQSTTSLPRRRQPHLVYLVSTATLFETQLGMMQIKLAEFYFQEYGIRSTAIRIPSNTIVSSNHWDDDIWDPHPQQQQQQQQQQHDISFVDDVVDGILAALQLYAPAATVMELSPTVTNVSTETLVQRANELQSLLTTQQPSATVHVEMGVAESSTVAPSAAVQRTRTYLQWFPITSLDAGLIRALAKQMDRQHPFGPPPPTTTTTATIDSTPTSIALNTSVRTGDALLEHYGMPTCESDDIQCHGGAPYFPCVSECNSKSHCLPSIFDNNKFISIMHEVLEGCDIVVYTQMLYHRATDLNLDTEYMDDGDPLICAVAVVAFESQLVTQALKKVPQTELARLGVTPRQEDGGKPDAIRKLKREKLNGRLLYRGWMLVWPDKVPQPVPHSDQLLLKLSPGRFFPPEVKKAIYIDQTFGVSPTLADLQFLVHELHRPALSSRIIKTKTIPKMRLRVPPEPSKRSVILLAELRYQESRSRRWRKPSSDKPLSLRQATRFMRYENRERLDKESSAIKRQREFYDRMVKSVNKNVMRPFTEPRYAFELKHWIRSRWVVHDMQIEEGRVLRCEWYHEHLQWKSTLDQLSFAYVMAKRELKRQVAFSEPDERDLSRLAQSIELKKMVTDVFEWHSLETDRNRHYSPYGPLSVVRNEQELLADPESPQFEMDFLFVRIISDRFMSLARKMWNHRQKGEADKDEE